ncbi:MAG: hypothetical protein R3C02_12345 [Planctomycetaceae bacterium]
MFGRSNDSPVHFILLNVMVVVISVIFAQGRVSAAEQQAATVAEAVKAIDLSKFPTLIGAEEVGTLTVAQLSYLAEGECKAAFEFQRKALTDLKWSELPGSAVTDQYASGVFTRDGFVLSVSVVPSGDPQQPNLLHVSINLHGNVDLQKLPTPSGLTMVYAGPQIAMYSTDSSVAETTAACRKGLLAAGWQPYGNAGDTHFFKQNAVRLTASINSAPGLDGKTAVSFSAEQMSADVPAPVDNVQLQYADSTKQVLFDTKDIRENIVSFYRNTLGDSKWQATTDHPVQIGFKDVLIFRNPAKDMLTLEMYPVEEEQVLRVTAKYETAAEVAAIEKKLDAEMAAAKKRAELEKNTPLPKVSVQLPAKARLTEESSTKWELTVATGQAKATVAEMRKQFKKSGWTEEVLIDDGMVGEITLKKGRQEVSFSYVDPGFIPAEITLQASHAELQKAHAKE